MAKAIANSSGDLSQGDVPNAESTTIDLGLNEQKHRFSTEKTLFSSAIGIAVLLYMTAIFFGFCLMVALQTHPDIHWHVSILIAAFIVPPTVIFVSLIRAVYRKPDVVTAEEDGKSVDTGLPALDMMKDFAKEVGKEVAKEVSKAVKP